MLFTPKIPQTADARVDHFGFRRQCIAAGYRHRGPIYAVLSACPRPLAARPWTEVTGMRRNSAENPEKGEGLMIRAGNIIAAGLMAAALALAAGAASAKDK